MGELLTNRKIQKKVKCIVCNKVCASRVAMVRHIVMNNDQEHLQFIKKQKEIIIDYYESGKTVNSIAHMGDVIFDSPDTVKKVLQNSHTKIRTDIKRWSKEEDNILRQNYIGNNMSYTQLCLVLPNRTLAGIERRINRLHFKKGYRSDQWSDEENALLKKYHKSDMTKLYALLPHRSKQSIDGQRRQLGFRRDHLWTVEEDDIIKMKYPYCQQLEILRSLSGRCWYYIIGRASQLKIKRQCQNSSQEQLMKYYLDQIYIDEDSIDNFRPSWLKRLELDRYYSKLGLAFEYNGPQHYKPHHFAQTKQEFVRQLERDKEKRFSCAKHKVRLVIIPYTFNLTLSNLRHEIASQCLRYYHRRFVNDVCYMYIEKDLNNFEFKALREYRNILKDKGFKLVVIYNKSLAYLQRDNCDIGARDFDVRVIDLNISRHLFRQYHYGRDMLPNTKLVFGLYYNDDLIGSVIYSLPSRNQITKSLDRCYVIGNVFELSRLVLIDGLPKNTGSYLIGKTVRHIKRVLKDVKALVSYADTTEGHEGTIYKASNWIEVGKTAKNYHYEDEKGNRMHKYAPWKKAKDLHITEDEYISQLGYKKVTEQSKIKFVLRLSY